MITIATPAKIKIEATHVREFQLSPRIKGASVKAINGCR
jgi:hypothetical protein